MRRAFARSTLTVGAYDGRRLDQPGEQRGLGHRDLGGVLAEVAERCGLDAVEPVAEIHLVEIHREDFVLRVLTLETRGDEDLGELAANGLVGGQEALSGELLRDRAAALSQAAFEDVVQGGAANADDIDTAVVVEALILDREDRLHEPGRDFRQRDIDALLAKDRERGLILRVEERRGLRHRADAAQRLAIGHLAGDAGDEPDDGNEDGGGRRRRRDRDPAVRAIERRQLRSIQGGQLVVERGQPGRHPRPDVHRWVSSTPVPWRWPLAVPGPRVSPCCRRKQQSCPACPPRTW